MIPHLFTKLFSVTQMILHRKHCFQNVLCLFVYKIIPSRWTPWAILESPPRCPYGGSVTAPSRCLHSGCEDNDCKHMNLTPKWGSHMAAKWQFPFMKAHSFALTFITIVWHLSGECMWVVGFTFTVSHQTSFSTMKQEILFKRKDVICVFPVSWG